MITTAEFLYGAAIAIALIAAYFVIASIVLRRRAARAVGMAMRRCPDGVPWHRVVNASGGISRRARMEGMLTQRMLLIREGIPLRNGRVRLRLAGPLLVDPYATNRQTGAFVLVDDATNETVGAGMVLSATA